VEFDITVIETLSRTISIDAESYDAALAKVEYMYNKQEIVLDSSDFKGKEIR
jgi:RecA-family ATPase